MNTSLTSAYPTARPGLTNLLRWQEPLVTRLRYRHALPGMVANRLLNVELGIYLMAELLPLIPPQFLSDLLNGQGTVYRLRPIWTPQQHRTLNQARTLLAPYRDRAVWLKALDKYATLAPEMRTFSVNGRGGWNSEISSYTLRERLNLFQEVLA
ncbi:pPIWI_RE_Z domain-containing protein [Spirosoma jeollabukense]